MIIIGGVDMAKRKIERTTEEIEEKERKKKEISGDASPGMTTYKGVKISVQERNMMMKLDFLNGNMDLQAIADKYGVTYGTIRTISSKEKWKAEREAYKDKVAKLREHKITQVFAEGQVEVNLMYNNAWQMIMELVYRELKTDKADSAIYKSSGKLDVYALDKLADILTKAQSGQYTTNGFVGREVQAKIDMQERQYTLKEKLSGILEDADSDIPVDNFMDALDQAIKQIANVDALVEDDCK